jgi:hypothetical protein
VTGEEELLSVSHTTGVTPRSQKNVTMFKAESYVGHKVARSNDIVINTMWAWMSALVKLVSFSAAMWLSRNLKAAKRGYVGVFLANIPRIGG